MSLPADIEPLLTSKKSRRYCEYAHWFCIPCIRAFRFLIDELNFRVTEVTIARHDCWVSFRHHNLRITVSMEQFCDRWGHFDIMADERSNTILKEVYFKDILPPFCPEGMLPYFSYEESDEELACWATLIKENWTNIRVQLLAIIER